MSCLNSCIKMEQHGLAEHHVQGGMAIEKKQPITFGTSASYSIDTPDFDVASDDELRALFGIGGG